MAIGQPPAQARHVCRSAGAAPAYAELAPRAEVALRARRLEALLGDPLDPANPYGLHALTAAAPPPPAPDAVDAVDAVGAVDGPAGAAGGARHALGADEFVRVLRPVLRRDLALGHAWAVRWAPARWAAPLGPAALVAAAGAILRDAARIVDERGRREPGARQWQPALAAVFADLLACESLTVLALRSLAADGEEPPCALVAAAGYVVPQLVGDLLDDLELVLNESGFGARSPQRLRLAKLVGDRAAAQADWTAAASWQARLVRALPALADPSGPGAACGTGGTAGDQGLFWLGKSAAGGFGTGCHGLVAAALADGAARPAGDADPATAGLARAARRLVTEQRALRGPCRAAGPADPADPAARALADRQALLLLAAAVLGVRQAAARRRVGFLGGPHWALLALRRITARLGVPLPHDPAQPQDAVWTELAGRGRRAVDCDVYATRLLW